jgi:2,6-dihydroxypyridine 3-monooxygenase
MSPSAVVVGGSLGALNAALFLRDAGFTVDVFERARTLLEGQGAGIVLNRATVRHLVENGAVDLADVSVASSTLQYLDRSGSIAAEVPEAYRFSSFDALYRALLRQFGRERYHLGEEGLGIEQDDDGAGVRLASGATTRADLVVCADGVRSAARAQLLPDVRPAYAGYIAWRGTVRLGQLAPAARGVLRGAITYAVMPNSHALAYPIPAVAGDGDAEPLLNWLWYRNVAEGAELDDAMTARDGTRRSTSLPAGLVPDERIAALRADAAAALPPQFAEMVRATAEPFIQAIFDIEVPRMAFGRVCLIGDAAFALRPHAAAGSAKAAEDAFRLGEAVRAHPGDVPGALAAWEPARLELGRSVLARTREAGNQSQFQGTWRPGAPLPFGLYRQGDSAMAAT